jgi:hypothetical protein
MLVHRTDRNQVFPGFPGTQPRLRRSMPFESGTHDRFLTHIDAFPTITPCGRARVAKIFEMGTYVNGRRPPLQGGGWGFESLRAHQFEISDLRFEI